MTWVNDVPRNGRQFNPSLLHFKGAAAVVVEADITELVDVDPVITIGPESGDSPTPL